MVECLPNFSEFSSVEKDELIAEYDSSDKRPLPHGRGSGKHFFNRLLAQRSRNQNSIRREPQKVAKRHEKSTTIRNILFVSFCDFSWPTGRRVGIAHHQVKGPDFGGQCPPYYFASHKEIDRL